MSLDMPMASGSSGGGNDMPVSPSYPFSMMRLGERGSTSPLVPVLEQDESLEDGDRGDVDMFDFDDLELVDDPLAKLLLPLPSLG